jgi:hypothetical protein
MVPQPRLSSYVLPSSILRLGVHCHYIHCLSWIPYVSLHWTNKGVSKNVPQNEMSYRLYIPPRTKYFESCLPNTQTRTEENCEPNDYHPSTLLSLTIVDKSLRLGSLKSYPLPILDTLCFSSMNQWRSMLERITKQNGIPIIYTPSPHTYLILWKLCTEYPNPYQRELQTKWLWSLNLVSSLQS